MEEVQCVFYWCDVCDRYVEGCYRSCDKFVDLLSPSGEMVENEWTNIVDKALREERWQFAEKYGLHD